MSKSSQVISVLISHRLIEPGATLSLQPLKLQGLILKKNRKWLFMLPLIFWGGIRRLHLQSLEAAQALEAVLSQGLD